MSKQVARNKQVEVPEGIDEAAAAAFAGYFPDPGDWSEQSKRTKEIWRKIVADAQPHLYKHFSNRLLSNEALEAAAGQWTEVPPYDETRKALQAALQATSIPTTSDEEG